MSRPAFRPVTVVDVITEIPPAPEFAEAFASPVVE